jgi:hypothetical protein
MLGIEISGFFRDFILLHFDIPYRDATELSNQIDRELKKANWLSLYDGTTFEKSYSPQRSRKR